MNEEARSIIARLGLEPLQGEGGYYVRTWAGASGAPRPAGELAEGAVAGGEPLAGAQRAAGSAIYFLITQESFSALHRLPNDELWHFHAGDPAELLMLDPRTGMKRLAVLGPKVMEGQEPQVAVPGGVWQGARIKPDPAAVRGWTLFSCTLAPAWDPSDFELGRTASLLEAFPSEARWIRALTRG